MKYLDAFLSEHHTPAVGTTYKTYKTRTCVPLGGRIRTDLTPEPPTEPTKPPPAFPEPPDDWTPAIPDRSVWRSVLATWGIPERQAWGELANRYEAEGLAWDAAEWRAFREVDRPDD